MRLRDPRSPDDADGRPDGYVDVQGDLVAVDEDGTFEHPAITEQWARAYAERQGVEYEAVVVDGDGGTDICGTEMSDGSVCERPADECPYHGD